MSQLYYEIDAQGRGVRIWRNLGSTIQSVYPPHVELPIEDGQTPEQRIPDYAEDCGLLRPSESSVRECHRAIGSYHPRVYRPTLEPYEHQSRPPYDKHARASGYGQLAALVEGLRSVFRYVEPDPDGGNLGAYGHGIRNLMLLACTEVEAQWRGVLLSNAAKGDRFTTKDYFSLKNPMRLAEYSLTLPDYPKLNATSPFASWTTPDTTASLPWYDAYNSVKHAREECFGRAQLRFAIDAVCACAIMLVAQYGRIPTWPAGEFFCFVNYPQWPYDEKYLMPIPDTRQWRAQMLRLD